ncbi:hypothetical protein Tco_1378919 [Tanacetum coccineum]
MTRGIWHASSRIDESDYHLIPITQASKASKIKPNQNQPSNPKALPKPKLLKKHKPALAQPLEKSEKPVSESSKAPPLAKHAKAGKVVKKRTVKSSKQLVDEFVNEGVPAAKPILEDTKEVILQKVLEESRTDAYPTRSGSLPPVVFRETELGQLQPLPRDVEITGSLQSTKTEHLDEGSTPQHTPDVQENLKLTVDEQVIPEEPISSTGTLSSLQHLAKDFSFSDQFLNDKPSEADNEKTTADTKA